MIVKQKAVYYCEYCRKHGLSRPAALLHESICTLNPNRNCRWSKADDHTPVDLSALVAELRERGAALDSDGAEIAIVSSDDIAWLEKQADGCPACMLAALRQSGVVNYRDAGFDYLQQVEKFREDERAAWRDNAW